MSEPNCEVMLPRKDTRRHCLKPRYPHARREKAHGTAPYGDYVRLLSDIEGPLVDLTRNALRSTLTSGSLDAVDLPRNIRVVLGNPRFISEIFSIVGIRLIYAQ